MNDNYLWDRTGEPDAEVQKLEELLGTLRYQPKPLRIPSSMSIARRRSYLPLAIAAALALIVLAAGLWLRIRTIQPSQPIEAARDNRSAPVAPLPAATINPNWVAREKQPPAPNIARRSPQLAPLPVHRPRARRPETQLTAAELAQKEQLITALRLVSGKLNLAQRKSQGLPQLNNIRNQHKIG